MTINELAAVSDLIGRDAELKCAYLCEGCGAPIGGPCASNCPTLFLEEVAR